MSGLVGTDKKYTIYSIRISGVGGDVKFYLFTGEWELGSIKFRVEGSKGLGSRLDA
jgi:hypothetical protein